MLEFLVQNAWKVTILWSAAFAAAVLLRRSSAATRHFIWAVAMAASLVLPLAALRPGAMVTTAHAVQTATVVTVHAIAPPSAAHASVAPQPTPPRWPLYLWLAGCLAVAARFLLGAIRASWMAGCSTELPPAREEASQLARALGIRRTVRVLSSGIVPVPMTWGVLRPVVLLPQDAAAWPPARLHAVLLHELIHVRRWDLAAQAIGQLACFLYWFHPLAWVGAARLRREREAACDDAVLQQGIPAHEYAGHLTELARSFAAARRAWSDAPAMAEGSGLELRVRALLDRNRSRTPLTRRAAALVALAAAACIVPMATRTARAQSDRGSLSGAVQDPSGAFVPNCGIVATNLNGHNEEITTANLAGQFRFASIPAGEYTLEFRSPGFKMLTQQVAVTAGGATQTRALLEVGTVREMVTVSAARPTNLAPQVASGTPQRIRVGGNVQMCKLVKQARPVYPSDARQEGVQGTVLIRAIISKTGDLLSSQVINTDVDSRLAKAAMDAVSQWKYQPTLLNGQPVEVLTDIDVTFELN